MRTRFTQFRPRARRGAADPGRKPATTVRSAALFVAALLAQPAWDTPAAAQEPVIRCCVQPPSGLRFWLPFNGSYTDVVAGLAGTPQGTVSWTGPVSPSHTGGGLSLAANARVDYPASTATSLGTGDFSVDAWIRLPQTSGVNPLLDNRIKAGQALTGFQLFVYNGRIGFQMADGAWSNFVAPTNVADNAWHFIVVTVARSNPQGGRIYVDGNLVHTFDPTVRAGSLGVNNRLVIGHDLNNNSPGSPFEIDEVEIFRRVLSQAEVTALFRYPKCPLPPSRGDATG